MSLGCILYTIFIYVIFSWRIAQKLNLLGLGAPKHSLIWSGNIILLQSHVDSLVVTISMDEMANVSLSEESLEVLKRILKPFASFDPSSDS